MDAKEKWDQLTEANRERLLEKHRDCEVQWNWWDDVYEMFREDMSAIGVHVETIYFSGFWSQGDGACFNGHVNDWVKFLTAVEKPELVEEAVGRDVSFEWQSLGRYSHENTVVFETSGLWVDNPYDEEDDEVRHVMWNAINKEGGLIYAVSDDLVEFLKDKMRGLYRQLEEEHEHLTSDEVVIEYILEHEEEDIDELLDEQREEQEGQEEHVMV